MQENKFRPESYRECKMCNIDLGKYHDRIKAAYEASAFDRRYPP